MTLSPRNQDGGKRIASGLILHEMAQATGVGVCACVSGIVRTTLDRRSYRGNAMALGPD